MAIDDQPAVGQSLAVGVDRRLVSFSLWRNVVLAFATALYIFVFGVVAAVLLSLPAWAVLDHDFNRSQADPAWLGLEPAWLLIVPLAYLVVLPMRALATRTVLSGGLLSKRTTYVTWHAPLARVVSIACPYRGDLRGKARTRLLSLDDGRSVDVVDRSRPRQERPTMRERLDELVTGDRAQSRYNAKVPVYAAKGRQGRGAVMLIVVGVVASAAAISTRAALADLRAHEADRTRTELADASVVRIDDHADGGTDIEVMVPVNHRLARALLWRSGRTDVRVEDTVRVSYDPDNLDNVEFADRSPTRAGPAWAVLATAGPVCVASVLTSIGIALHLGRQARSTARRARLPQ